MCRLPCRRSGGRHYACLVRATGDNEHNETERSKSNLDCVIDIHVGVYRAAERHSPIYSSVLNTTARRSRKSFGSNSGLGLTPTAISADASISKWKSLSPKAAKIRHPLACLLSSLHLCVPNGTGAANFAPMTPFSSAICAPMTHSGDPTRAAARNDWLRRSADDNTPHVPAGSPIEHSLGLSSQSMRKVFAQQNVGCVLRELFYLVTRVANGHCRIEVPFLDQPKCNVSNNRSASADAEPALLSPWFCAVALSAGTAASSSQHS